MKKIQLLAVLLLSSIITFASYNNTRLVISTLDNNNNIRIVIDGYDVGYRYKNGNSYLLNDISSSYHRIQIFKYSTGIFGKNKERIIYDQNLFLKQNYETNISLNTYGNVSINEYPIGNGGWWSGSNNYPPKGNRCNNDRDRKRGHEKHHGKYDDRYENNNNQPDNREWKGNN